MKDESDPKVSSDEGNRKKGIRSRKIKNLEHLGKYITLANRAQNALIAQKLGGYDVTRGQLPILLALYQKESVSQQELSDMYDLDKSVVTRTIDRLEENDFVYRRVSPKDRRKNLIHLTRKAEEFKPTLISVLEEKEEQLNRGISEEEKRLFRLTIKKMIANLKEELDSEIK